jgi:hypothetical protein
VKLRALEIRARNSLPGNCKSGDWGTADDPGFDTAASLALELDPDFVLLFVRHHSIIGNGGLRLCPHPL